MVFGPLRSTAGRILHFLLENVADSIDIENKYKLEIIAWSSFLWDSEVRWRPEAHRNSFQ